MGNALYYLAVGGSHRSTTGLFKGQGLPPDTPVLDMSTWVETSDGRMMCSFMLLNDTTVYVGYCPKNVILDPFLGDPSFVITDIVPTGATIIEARRVAYAVEVDRYRTSLFRDSDGSVLMVRHDFDLTVGNCLVYKSASGNGDDFVLHGTIRQVALTATISSGPPDRINPIIKLESGRLLYGSNTVIFMSGYLFASPHIFTSDDGGSTWTLRWSYTTLVGGLGDMSQVTLLPDGSLITEVTFGSGTARLYDSVDNGVTWVYRLDCSTNFGGVISNSLYFGSFFYDLLSDSLYRCTSAGQYIWRCQAWRKSGYRLNANWQLFTTVPGTVLDNPCPLIYTTPAQKLCFGFSNNGVSVTERYRPLIFYLGQGADSYIKKRVI